MDIEADKGEAKVLAASLVQQVNREDVANMVQVQRGMLQRFEKTNEMLINFNQLSFTRYEASVKDFQQHTQLLYDMKKDLDSVFKRIRVLKQRLSKSYPDAFAACSSVIMMEDGEGDEEQVSATTTTTPTTTTTSPTTTTTSTTATATTTTKSSTHPSTSQHSSCTSRKSGDREGGSQRIAQPQKPRSRSTTSRDEEGKPSARKPRSRTESGHTEASSHSKGSSAGGHSRPKPL